MFVKNSLTTIDINRIQISVIEINYYWVCEVCNLNNETDF